jgi:small subunit ribosomal protein S11
MAEEKKQQEEEVIVATPEISEEDTDSEVDSEVLGVDELEEDEDDDEVEESVTQIMSADDELPEEIKQKLEKNKQARAKKKLIKKKKKKVAKTVKSGKAFINATYNNTILSLTDNNGDVISWASAGLAGFKGAKKATPYAAQIITKIAAQKAKEEYGLEEVRVYVSGVGTGREAAIRALNANGLNVTAIKDVTPIPHNGCRPKKPRRV